MPRLLDAKGLTCPLPVLKTQKAMRELAPGEELTIEATDPAAPEDFAAFCEAQGHEMLANSEVDGIYRFLIRKGG
ncbi:MAG: sulfurtransferase TusA family protein [Alphaproteobacteria bacterium]|nr:sulfurtransferase TusA family protein [Alphaproteobacteria bacterium]MCW5751302.1 sulfurtransferase TusA family protein [Alphaproteobacteria bacterium]